MPHALIVAHGAPADPAPQEAALMALAVRVALWCPGWTIRAATLAAPGALESALARLDRPLIYPFFMAEGWFTRTILPKRLAAAGHGDLTRLHAFGTDPALPALAADIATTATTTAGLRPADTTLLLAAHGSQVSRASATITEQIATTLRNTTTFARIITGYVEEDPTLESAATASATASGPKSGPAICLPLFALSAGHVTGDVPRALAAAGFRGPLLPPIGAAAQTAPLIAAALHRANA